MKNVIVAPSILSGNFAAMGDEVNKIVASGADWVHIDVMDGVFVPNLTFGFKMVTDLRPYTSLPFDVHLMIDRPSRYIKRFARSGADLISFHFEAERDVKGTIARIKDCGCMAGLAINPNTDVEKIAPFATELDLVLVMTVYPGFGGQKFIDGSLNRIALCRDLCPNAHIEVDGGVTTQNAKDIIAAGADVLVCGSTFFKTSDKVATVKSLRG